MIRAAPRVLSVATARVLGKLLGFLFPFLLVLKLQKYILTERNPVYLTQLQHACYVLCTSSVLWLNFVFGDEGLSRFCISPDWKV